MDSKSTWVESTRRCRPDREFLVAEKISLADICFVAELVLFFNEKARSGELIKKGLEPILHRQRRC